MNAVTPGQAVREAFCTWQALPASEMPAEPWDQLPSWLREKWESIAQAAIAAQQPQPASGGVLSVSRGNGTPGGTPMPYVRTEPQPVPASASQVRRLEVQQPAPELAGEGAVPDVRPRSDGRRGLDITCGKCGEDYGTNVTDLDQIECPECEARRCPQCRAWHGGNQW